jgi:hypothetical protein
MHSRIYQTCQDPLGVIYEQNYSDWGKTTNLLKKLAVSPWERAYAELLHQGVPACRLKDVLELLEGQSEVAVAKTIFDDVRTMLTMAKKDRDSEEEWFPGIKKNPLGMIEVYKALLQRLRDHITTDADLFTDLL